MSRQQEIHTPVRAQRGGNGRWIAAIVVLVVLTEQSALSFNLIAPALLGIAQGFQTTQVIWVITVFVLVGAVTTPVVGKLGDRFGKRRVLVWIAVISLVGSVIAALAPTFSILLVGRALMGLATAYLPLTIALMRDTFPRHIRTMAIAIAMNGVGVVTIIGPFLAGLLIDNFGVASVFWFTAVLSLIGAVGVIALVPESPVRNLAKIDLLGALWLMLGVLVLMIGLNQLQPWGIQDVRTLAALGGGAILLVGWWIYERKVDFPFIDTRLISTRPVLSLILVYSFIQAAITVAASYLPTMLQTPRELTEGAYGFGLTATQVAIFMVPTGVTTVASGLLVGALAKKTGLRVYLYIGPLFMIASGLMLGNLREFAWMPIVAWAFGGLAAAVWAAAPNMLMQAAPPATRGEVSGMMGAVQGVIASVGTQLAAVLLTFQIATVTPDGTPIYTGTGMVLVFGIAALFGLFGLIAALFVPRQLQQVESDVAEEAVVEQPGLPGADLL